MHVGAGVERTQPQINGLVEKAQQADALRLPARSKEYADRIRFDRDGLIMKIAKPIVIVALATAALISLAACERKAPDSAAVADSKAAADTIYFNGSIITMNDAVPFAEALAEKDGRIIALGSKADVFRLRGDHTRLSDLSGKALLPGFIDAHSHFSGVGLQAVSANLLPPPDGPVSTIAQVQQVMRDYIASSPLVKQYGVAIGFNYDDSQLAEKRSPTAAELDAVNTDIPVIIIHQSGHLAVYNSAALAKAGITAASVNPPGGVIRRKPGSRQPDGVLEENAHFTALLKVLPRFTAEQAMQQLEAAQKIYAANGFTTVQDGRSAPSAVELLSAAAKAGKLGLDVVAYPDLEMNLDNPALDGPLMSHNYTQRFRIGGVKLTFDGSPQGKTAWFTKPYFKVPAGQLKTYAGYPSFKDEAKAQALVSMARKKNWPLLVHSNGDAAIDQLIRTVAKAEKEAPAADHRTVLIHGQYLREDQVNKLKELSIFPSLYPMHTFYWGDWHRESVAGPERAENISPTGWLLARHMIFSIHSDAPVTFPNSMRILDSAVNRTTRSGYVIGPQHRLTPLLALKAITIWPAYQYFEEADKGSLETGKLADLVILDKNPLTVAPTTLQDIKVVETIKEGKTVYRR